MKLYHFVRGTIAVAAIALVPVGTAVANVRAAHATPPMLVRNHNLPQLVVSEAFDIAGGYQRAVSFAIVDGILQPNPIATFNSDTIITTSPGGLFYNLAGSVTIETIDLLTGKVLRQVGFGPPRGYGATALTLDREGRLYVAFQRGRVCCENLIAILPRNARGHVHPNDIIQLGGRETTKGLAVHNDALYVSRSEFFNGGNRIEIYAPLAHPKLVGQITGLHNPNGIAFDSAGELYICNEDDGDVLAVPAHQRGPVHPDRTITNPNHSLCSWDQNPFVFNAGGLAVLGTHLFVGANASSDVVELDTRRDGVQNPLVRVHLGEGSDYPWSAIEIAVTAP